MKRVLAVLLLMIGVVLGMGVAIGGFLQLVRWSSRVEWIGALALALFLAVEIGVAWWASLWVSRRHRITVVWIAASCGLIAFVALAGSSVFRSMDFAYTPAVEPSGVAYWQLATGSRLAYLRTPAATATAQPSPVLFVHGGPGLPELVDQDVRLAVAELGFDVYTYHQFGAGLSNRAVVDRRRQYTVARHVADLEAIRVHLGAPRLILVGQSWGATLSASYAAAHPERVEKLVLTSPGPSWLPAFDSEQIRVLDSLSDDDFWQLRELIRPYVARLALLHYLLKVNSAAAEQYLTEGQLDAFVEAQGKITKRAYVCDSKAAEPHSFSGQSYWVNHHVFADLRRIADPRPSFLEVTAPVLILKPECDYVDEEIALDFRDRFPNAVLLSIEGAGHEIRWERPDRYRQALGEFLADREP